MLLPAGIHESHIPIDSDEAIVEARQCGRTLASEAGFTAAQQAMVASVISELGRNALRYGISGYITVRILEDGDRCGVMVVAGDAGPGIPNVTLALQDGYSTSGSLGLGLPGARRLMDEFNIDSGDGHGTTVTAKKWK